MTTDSSLPTQPLQFARLAMVMQVAALVVLIGLSLPKYLDYALHPLTCNPDLVHGFPWSRLRDIGEVLGPSGLLPLITARLRRRPRRWPTVPLIVLDVVLIGLVIYDAISVALTRHDQNPAVVVQVVLVLVPEYRLLGGTPHTYLRGNWH